MDGLEELRVELNARRERIMANPDDYGASEFKFRTDELRRAMLAIERLMSKQAQPALRRVA